MPMCKAIILGLSSSVVLAACSVKDDANTAAAMTTSAETGVVREVVTPTPVPGPVVQQLAAAIQTQPGPKGTSVALNRVAVTGDIMTVALTYTGGDCCIYTPLADVSAIDDATSQRIGVLKDNTGKWMAAPVYSNDKELRIDASKPAQVWLKFPAPPATSKTVSITLPDVAPFDAVPVAR